MLQYICRLIGILFLLCYAYQFFYIPVALFRKPRPAPPVSGRPKNRYAVLICARNEAAVIADLIDSIRRQTYPSELISVFVMADNCTDFTGSAAAEHGAKVYLRFDGDRIGKGYALDVLLRRVREDYPGEFDGYFVFDADNILAPDYIEQMDRSFSAGNEIVTGFRNSKNFSDNWISSGYALCFMRESRCLNYARSRLGISCSVSGTGFLFSEKIAAELGGWPFHLLTEDAEFSIDQIAKGRKIAYCGEAEFFDEQPTELSQSWRQRMRWSRGYIQVFHRYRRQIAAGILHGSFSCYDMAMTIMPAFVLSVLSLLAGSALSVQQALSGSGPAAAMLPLLGTLASMYGTLFLIGVLTAAAEWRRIHATPGKKILSVFTFPLFMMTFLPIALSSLFGKVTWKPIVHRVTAAQSRLGNR